MRVLKFERRFQEDTLKQIQEMVALKESRFSDLEEIMICMDTDFLGTWAHCFRKRNVEETKRICRDAGVDLTMLNSSQVAERTIFNNWAEDQMWVETRLEDGFYKTVEHRPKIMMRNHWDESGMLHPQYLTDATKFHELTFLTRH